MFSIAHYDDVIMGAIASQITSLTSVYSTVYSGANQSKHQSSASLAFVWVIHLGPVNSPHKCPVTRKFVFHLMTSSCIVWPRASMLLSSLIDLIYSKYAMSFCSHSLQWRPDERDGVSITGVSVVYWTVCSGADPRKHQSSALPVLCAGNSPVIGEFPA